MKKILSLIIAVVMLASCVTVAAAKDGFSDVAEDRWSAASIKYAVDNGYMKGVGGDKFDPEGSLTRAMVATVLWRREGEPKPTAPSGFVDVPANEWYTDAVAWAKETGVVKGITDKTFEPDGKITREQLATMLFRFSSSAPVSVPERADLTPFSDDEKVSEWANEPLEWAVEAGLIKGTDGNRLAPDGDATREQFAAIIERYDGTFTLKYNTPVVRSHYTEPEYPLVDDADFYVSVNGDDSADGSFDHPFRTWERARDAVCMLDKTGRSGVKVAFMAGDYGPISVVLRREDSGTADCPIIYCKYGDGDVVFNDGLDVTEDEFTDLSDGEKAFFKSSVADKIKKADLSGRLRRYDPRTCLILGDDGEMTLARFPNKFPDGSDNLLGGSHENIDDYHIRIDNYLFLKKLESYHTTEGLLLYGYLTTGWYKDLLGTADYDPETHVFRIPRPEQARMGYLRRLPEFDSKEWSKVAVVNVSEELDAAGEYWIDAETSTFYVFDPEGDYHFTGGENSMLTVIGTEYLTLRGLSFKNSDPFMIWADYHPRGLTLDRCTFSGCAADRAVVVRGEPGGVPLDVTVTGCVFSVTAGQQLEIKADYDYDDLFTSGTGVTVDNNYFTLACLRLGCNGALRIAAPFARVTHNHFKRCYWEDIDFRNAANLVAEYNVFEESCCNGDDTGAMQTFRNFEAAQGSVVRYNLFMNIRGGTNGRYGLYLDGSWGAEVCGNVFFNCDKGVMNNGVSRRNYIHDNIVVNPNSTDGAISTIHTEGQEIVRDALERDDMSIITNDWLYVSWSNYLAFYNAHPELKAQTEELWPGIFDIHCDLDRMFEREFCMNSEATIRNNAEINITGSVCEYSEESLEYSDVTPDAGYTLDENPFFVNPTTGDYRVREGADFFNIQFENIGRY